MKRFCIQAWVVLLLVGSCEVFAQRQGPPRRMENPQTIVLDGGSRVEFREFYSAQLGEKIRYSIFLPPSYSKSTDKTYPVVYFLHGLFNDDTSWCTDRYGDFPPRVEQLVLSGKAPEFLMVHPQGKDSFYTDAANGGARFESYLRTDLIQEIEKNFRAKQGRSDRSIGGTSMGGYGALKLGMKYPELYASALAGSPIVLLGEDPTVYWNGNSSRFGQYFSSLFGTVFGTPFDPKLWEQNSLESIAREADLENLKIRILYGTADRYNDRIPMEKGIRTLKKILDDRKAAVELEVFEGEPHGWNLLVNHFEECILFLTQSF